MILRFTALLIVLFIIYSCAVHNMFKSNDNSQNTAATDSALTDLSGMVLIKGDWFEMGSSRRDNEHPPHTVYVRSFYIDKYEVSVEQFQEFCYSTGRKMPEQPRWNRPDHPVVNVTWTDARDFARWKGKRLVTEAEWEYAARCKRTDLRYDRRQIDQYRINYGNIADESLRLIKYTFPVKEKYDDGHSYTSPVGFFPSNSFGVFDMDGNVLEWCQDWYEETYYKESTKLNPTGPESGSYRVIRGASWNRSGKYLRSTYRSYYPPECTFDFLGFRCAMDVEDTKGNASAILVME